MPTSTATSPTRVPYHRAPDYPPADACGALASVSKARLDAVVEALGDEGNRRIAGFIMWHMWQPNRWIHEDTTLVTTAQLARILLTTPVPRWLAEALWQRVGSPPDGRSWKAGDTLTADQVARLDGWIEIGGYPPGTYPNRGVERDDGTVARPVLPGMLALLTTYCVQCGGSGRESSGWHEQPVCEHCNGDGYIPLIPPLPAPPGVDPGTRGAAPTIMHEREGSPVEDAWLGIKATFATIARAEVLLRWHPEHRCELAWVNLENRDGIVERHRLTAADHGSE